MRGSVLQAISSPGHDLIVWPVPEYAAGGAIRNSQGHRTVGARERSEWRRLRGRVVWEPG